MELNYNGKSRYLLSVMAMVLAGIVIMMFYIMVIGQYKDEIAILQRRIVDTDRKHLQSLESNEQMSDALSKSEQELNRVESAYTAELMRLREDQKHWERNSTLDKVHYEGELSSLHLKVDALLQGRVHKGAFVTLVTPSFWKPGLVLVQTVRDTGVSIRFIIMCVDPSGYSPGSVNHTKLPVEAEQAFERLNAEVRYIEQVPVPSHAQFENPRWAIAWNKLRAFEYTEYDKLVFLDSDMMVMQDISEMLTFPDFSAAPGHEIPCETHHGVSGGTFVFAPNTTIYRELLEFAETDPGDHWRQAEQELLAFFYPRFYKHRLHLISGLYNMSLRSCQCLLPIVFTDHVKIIHFYSGAKPWDHTHAEWQYLKNGNYPECVVNLALKWYSTLERGLMV